jgi:hypothetical protein
LVASNPVAKGDNTPEFDRFGPWIDEVHDVDELPRLYRDAGIDPGAYRLVLKVPRDIERRDADPGMHLYDYLITVDEENLTVMARHEEEFDTLRVGLDRIAAIADCVRLLSGHLGVHTVDGPVVTVPYNASAGAGVQKLTALLRRWYLPKELAVVADAGHRDAVLGRADTGLVNDYQRMLTQEPGMRLVNVTDRQVVTAQSPQGRRWPTILHASIVATDDREIQVIHRHDWFTGAGVAPSLARTVLPRARITDIHVRPHELYENVHTLTVEAGEARLELHVTDGPLVDAIRSGGPADL